MTHEAYSTKRVTVWDQARDGVPGKVIKYQDGYQSWCPESMYQRDYQPLDALSFGHALDALKKGGRVCRAGWNGKGMWLALVPAHSYEVAPGLLDHVGENPCNPETLPWIGMKTADGKFVPWLASQTDVLADDWTVL